MCEQQITTASLWHDMSPGTDYDNFGPGANEIMGSPHTESPSNSPAPVLNIFIRDIF